MRSILPLYLQHLGESVKSKSAVEEAVNAIGWVHQVSGLPPIAESPFVRACHCRVAAGRYYVHLRVKTCLPPRANVQAAVFTIS